MKGHAEKTAPLIEALDAIPGKNEITRLENAPVCLSSVFPLCNQKWSVLCPPHFSTSPALISALSWESPVMAVNCGLCGHLTSVSLWNVRDPEKGKKEDFCLIFLQASITEESGRIVSASDLNLELNLWAISGGSVS